MKLQDIQEARYSGTTPDDKLPEWCGANSDYKVTEEYRSFIRQHGHEYNYLLDDLEEDAMRFEIHNEDDIFNWSDSAEANAGPHYNKFYDKISEQGGEDHLEHAEADVHAYIRKELYSWF